MLTAGASASCSEPLPSHGASKVCREQRVGGAARQAAGGSSAWHSPRARGQRQGMAPSGSAAPHKWGRWASPHWSCTLPEGSPPRQGLQGSGGRQRRGAGLAPCMLHSRPWDRRNTDAGKWGTSRDPKRRGALGSCAARRTEIPRMGAPIEEQGPRNTECPRGKRDHGSPGASSAWKWAARGKGTEVG